MWTAAMLTRRRDKARRVVMWAAGVVLVLSVAAWVVSTCWFVGIAGSHGGIQLGDGDFVVYRGGFLRSKGWHIVARVEVPPERVFGEFLTLPWEQPEYEARVPIWTLGIGAGVVLFGAWCFSRRDRLRAEAEHCRQCGYDLTGIDGVCPECGAGR